MDKKVRIISDSNMFPFLGQLQEYPNFLKHPIEVTDYGQVYQSISKEVKSFLDIVWTSPEKILPSFNAAYQLRDVPHQQVIAEVEEYIDLLLRHCKSDYVFVSSWALPEHSKGYGILDWKEGIGLTNLLMKCNLKIAEKLEPHDNFFMFDVQRLLSDAANPVNHKLWYATKVPYSIEVFQIAAKQMSATLDAINGKSKRLIVLDLDNTIWGGVVGENGWQHLRLGGHDHIGEAFKHFQSELKALTNRGVQLALASKNDLDVALEAIENHPEMILTKDDFCAWRINWRDKAENIVDMVAELNLGLGSVIFIDDNPVERLRVADAVPEILVPEWPKDPTMYVSALRKLSCFEAMSVSAEDRHRKSMYVAERTRRDIKAKVDDKKDWLNKLGTTVTVESLSDKNIVRAVQLFNKTNQLNLSTRRLTEAQIVTWAEQQENLIKVISVEDSFGKMGIVGILGLSAEGKEGVLLDYILSCRVMGRKVEEALIYIAATELIKKSCLNMHIEFIPTERNRPTLEILKITGLKEIKPNYFNVDLSKGIQRPTDIFINGYP
jgi:FkbH-like protein